MVRTRSKKTAKNFIAALHQIRYSHRGKKIHIVVDNATIHSAKTKLLQKFRDDYRDQIVIHFLPKRSPILNSALERFWGFSKLRVATNWFYQTQDDLEQAFRRFVWHYRQGNISYNFSLSKFVKIWEKHPTFEQIANRQQSASDDTAA
jgi:transposase InsO family protein